MMRSEALAAQWHIVQRRVMDAMGNPIWIMLPALVLLIVVYAFPLFIMLRYSVFEPSPIDIVGEDLTLSNYVRFFSDYLYIGVLLRTLLIAGISTTLTLIIGYPLAWMMARGPVVIQRFLLLVVLLPLMVSVVIRSFAWTAILGLDGPVNNILITLHLTNEPLRLLNNQMGIVIGLTYVYLPFMVLPLSTVLAKIDPDIESAASTLGATGLQTFRRIILPLSIPGIAAGAVLVFTLSMSAYVTPALLGGGTKVVTTFVAQQVLQLLNWPMGSAIAAVLMLIVVVIVALYSRWLESRTKFYGRVDR